MCIWQGGAPMGKKKKTVLKGFDYMHCDKYSTAQTAEKDADNNYNHSSDNLGDGVEDFERKVGSPF